MKKFITVILTLAMLASLAVATSAANGKPGTILGFDYETKLLCDFSPNSFTEATQKADCVCSTDKGVLALNCSNIFNESKVTLVTPADPTGYTGIMLYYDATEAVNDGGLLGIRIYFEDITGYVWTRDTLKDADGKFLSEKYTDYKIEGYYMDDAGNWKKTAQSYTTPGNIDKETGNGERLKYPANYRGWVYVPFSSYNTTKVNDSTDKYPRLGLPAGKKIIAVQPLVGSYDKDQTKNIYVDDIMLVKLTREHQGGSAETFDAVSVAVACTTVSAAAAVAIFANKKKRR